MTWIGVNLCPHWFHDLHAPLLATLPNGELVEYFPDAQVLNFRELLDRQLEVRDGELVLHDAPGLGFGFLDEAVERTALTPWAEVWASK